MTIKDVKEALQRLRAVWGENVSGISPKIFEIDAGPARSKRGFKMVTRYAERIMLIMETKVARAERYISKKNPKEK